MDKSHRPLSKHPTTHTDLEIKWIKDLIKRNPHITLCEVWYKLKLNKGYTRHIGSLYRVLKKLGFIHQVNIKNTSKYIPQQCKVDNLPEDLKFYQYTYIDEATRE